MRMVILNRRFLPKIQPLKSLLKWLKKLMPSSFLASDSQEIKDLFKKKFPDKIVTLEHDIVLTYKCDTLKNYEVTKEQRIRMLLGLVLVIKM
jgi:hypothetical protein